ncbi:MAG: hypothetical protein JWR59_2515 [Brevundimonas sp.]|nr:hypothetical protein [Brevundimonas sp.]
MKVITSVYKDDGTFYAKLPSTLKDEAYISDVSADIESFVEEQFYAIKDEDDE